QALESLRAGFRDGLISEDVFKQLEGKLLDVKDGGEGAAGAISILGGSAKEASGELEDGTKELDKFHKTAMELASNEKIAAMEFSADIRVAEIEADAKKVEAVMSSLATTVDSTGQVLGGLFDDRFGNNDLSRWDQVGLDSAIRKEQERREEAVKLQNEAAKAQIENMKARTEALRNGEGLIKID
ncbi:hypothetical protein, partial [Staphylococcus aureus]|uniref:hypothetical protein n=1 Tax=Staphylococcus aureus TaxID=1280 RepID=UPI00301CC732